jgi:hypothetical protein
MRTIRIEHVGRALFVTDWNHKCWKLFFVEERFRCSGIEGVTFKDEAEFIETMYGKSVIKNEAGETVFENYRVERI